MHILHAIHDFLPRHRAGSELYALGLAQAQLARHDVTVLCADFDPSRPHGETTWRVHDGVPVVEIVNNWRCDSFEDTYRPPLIGQRTAHLLEFVRPDVVHGHNLLNLTFDLPAQARRLGIPVVATLHDYSLFCASGGQRLHVRANHVCHDIEPARCAECVVESPFHAQQVAGRVSAARFGGPIAARAAATARRVWPAAASRAVKLASAVATSPVTPAEIEARSKAALNALEHVDLVVAPSAYIRDEFAMLGAPADRILVDDYGMAPMRGRRGAGKNAGAKAPAYDPRLRIGFVGTLVWHKGVHILLDAVRRLPAGEYTLTVYGSEDTFPDYAASLRSQATGLPVRFAAGFDACNVSDVYASLDVLVVPSIWLENSPLVIHEAFMAGVAVVGARTGGIPGLVTDGVNGALYQPESAEDLSRALRQLIDDRALVARYAAAAPRVKTLDEDAAGWDAHYQRAGVRL